MLLVNEVLGAAWNGDGREALGMLCRIQGCSKCPKFGVAGVGTLELSFLSASTKNKLVWKEFFLLGKQSLGSAWSLLEFQEGILDLLLDMGFFGG